MKLLELTKNNWSIFLLIIISIIGLVLARYGLLKGIDSTIYMILILSTFCINQIIANSRVERKMNQIDSKVELVKNDIIKIKKEVAPFSEIPTSTSTNLEGTWQDKGEKKFSGIKIKFNTVINIKQHGIFIKGKILLNDTFPDGRQETIEGSLEGRVHLNKVLLNYFPKTNKDAILGSLLLTISHNANRLKGVVIFENREDNSKIEIFHQVNLIRITK